MTVNNDGNAPTSVNLDVQADAKLVHKLGQSELALTNGGDAVVDVDARVKRRPWLGPENSYAVHVRAMAEQTVART